MLQRKWLIGGAALALLGIVVLVRGFWTTDGVAARTQGQARPVPVETATVERKTLPVQIRALGTVTPIAAVAIKTQVDTTITSVRFLDGARVEKGDELFTLDCRQIEADMKRVEAVINGAQATFEQAQRDVERYTDLVARNATPIVTLNNAQTQVNISNATAESNRAQLENLKSPAWLLHDPRADLRPHQHGQCEGRQFRASGRHLADGDNRADGARSMSASR
jgi:multidrug efflux pump subunit AcrA (membrane-fusion protein)